MWPAGTKVVSVKTLYTTQRGGDYTMPAGTMGVVVEKDLNRCPYALRQAEKKGTAVFYVKPEGFPEAVAFVCDWRKLDDLERPEASKMSFEQLKDMIRTAQVTDPLHLREKINAS